MKRLALIVLGLMALALSACAPTADITTRVPVLILSVHQPAVQGGEVVVQGRNFGDGRTGGEEANHVLFAPTPDGKRGQRLATTSWTPTRIEFDSPDDAGNGWLIIVAGGVASEAFPISLP